MSRLKQLILTLCALSCVFILYYFHPYFTLLLVILTVVAYLYIDYENHQPRHRLVHTRSSSISNYLNAFRSWAVTYIPNEYKNYIFKKPSDITPRPNMPSITPYAINSRRPSAQAGTSSFLVSPNLNENRLRSSAHFNSLNSSSNAFNALSPIRRNNISTPRASTSHEFNNLSISGLGLRSPQQTPNQQYASPSYASNSSRDSSFKLPRSGSAPRHVQAFAGPLLASTRYNLSSDSALFADVNSTGLSSRVARYGSDSLNSSWSATHQAQYSGPGQFPIVHLGKASKLPVLSARNSQKLARTPVRVRMAPSESSERRSYSLSDRSQILSDYSPSMSTPKSVLDTLHEMSRKRLHAQLGEVEDEAAKKQRKSGAADDALTQKRGRDESALEHDDQTKKKTKSNEILSSLSSSRNLASVVAADRSSVKRKTSPADVSNGSTPMPAGKVLKKSLPSPEVPASLADQCETAVQTEASPHESAAQFTTQTITPAQSMEETLSDTAYRKTVMRGEMHGDWLRRGFLHTEQNLKLNAVKDKREEDAKSRLKGMMSVIGGKTTDAEDLNFAVISQSSTLTLTASTSTSLAPQQSTMFTTKPPEKHVHFADNLTQVKTFENASSESTSTLGSDSAVEKPAVLEKSLDTSRAAIVIPLAKPLISVVDGFKMPSPGAPVSFGSPKQSGFGTSKDTQDTVTNFGALTQANTTETSKSVTSEASKTGGFSFGATTSVPSPVTFGLTGMPSLGQSITTATPSSIGLEQITSPVVPKTSNVTSTFGQIAPSLGGVIVSQTTSPIMSTTFGSTASNIVSPTFGQQTTATSTFGQSPAVSTFGQNASFGTPTASPAMFGTVTSSFGSSTTTAGSTLTSTASPKPAFSSTFGGSSTVSSAFSSGAAALPATISAFGSSTPQSTTTFGSSASTTGPTFGSSATGSAFGSSAPTSATTASVFGSSAPSLTTTVPQDRGFTIMGSKPETPKLFGFGGVTSPQANVFAPQTKPVGFGAQPQNPPPPYGAVTANTTQGAFAFGGSSNTSSAASSSTMFGAKSEQQMTTPTFGSAVKNTAFQFNPSQSAVDPSQGNGGFKFDLPQTTKPSPSPSLFGGFNATSTDGKPATAQGTFAFGAAAPAKQFSFGDAKTATPSLFGNNAPSPISSIQSPSSGFGQSVFGSQTQQQTGVNASNLTQIPTQQKPAGIFSFGGTAAPAPAATQSTGFSFGSTAKPSGGFAFGSAATTATPAFGQTAQPAPSFGQAAQPTPSFGQTAQPAPSFGQTTQPTPSFGQTAQPAPSFGQTAQPTPSFGQTAQLTPSFGQTAQITPSFGQTVQPASSGGAFQFGSAPSVPTGGFNFGGGSSSSATPSFGGAPASNAFPMGGAPQFGGMQPQQAPGMFSIGTGSSAPRGRLARSRRPR